MHVFESSDVAFSRILSVATNSDTSPPAALAKILAWTLRRDLTAPPQSSGGQTALESIKGFATLLEHYFHSSNSGSYSGDLADFLSGLITHVAGARLRWEAALYWKGADHVKLDAAALQPLTDVLFKLASVSLHHRNSDMQAAAAQCLARLTYLMPDKCLPLVVQRLHEALDSYDAVHQIEQTINLSASALFPFFNVRNLAGVSLHHKKSNMQAAAAQCLTR